MLAYATIDNLSATGQGSACRYFSPADFRSPQSSLQCAMVKSRHYCPPLLGQQEPNWYFDVTQPPIATRPVIAANTTNTLLPALPTNVTNLKGHTFNCYQPQWCPSCL